jgi:hypothetical protein
MERRLRNLWDRGDTVGIRDKTHPRNLPFGGFDIFLFGDFKQLPPVGSRPMYAPVREHDLSKIKATHVTTIQMSEKGHDAYMDINKVITLPDSIRQDDADMEAHLDQIGIGDCHSHMYHKPCEKTGLTDRMYWKTQLINEFTPTDAAREWMEHPDTITLVHENAEALLISAEYAVRQTEKRGIPLWQWHAINTTSKARKANMSDVGGLRNQLGIFVGMQVMLLENAYGGPRTQGTHKTHQSAVYTQWPAAPERWPRERINGQGSGHRVASGTDEAKHPGVRRRGLQGRGRTTYIPRTAIPEERVAQRQVEENMGADRSVKTTSRLPGGQEKEEEARYSALEYS